MKRFNINAARALRSLTAGKRIFLLILVLGLALVSVSGGATDDASNLVPEVKGFQNWKPLVEGLKVSAFMWGLCAQHTPIHPLLSHTDLADGSVELVGRRVSAFANNAAYTHITDKEPGPFPTGSVIAKEKLRDKGPRSSLGIMIKRAPGFDPQNADWEFLFVSSDRKVSRGATELNNCYTCHRAGKFGDAAANDFVFVGTYANLPREHK